MSGQLDEWVSGWTDLVTEQMDGSQTGEWMDGWKVWMSVAAPVMSLFINRDNIGNSDLFYLENTCFPETPLIDFLEVG